MNARISLRSRSAPIRQAGPIEYTIKFPAMTIDASIVVPRASMSRTIFQTQDFVEIPAAFRLDSDERKLPSFVSRTTFAISRLTCAFKGVGAKRRNKSSGSLYETGTRVDISVSFTKLTNGVGGHLRRLPGPQTPASAVCNGSDYRGTRDRRLGNLVGESLRAALEERLGILGAAGNERATGLGPAFKKQKPMRVRPQRRRLRTKFFVFNFKSQFAVEPRFRRSPAEFGKVLNGVWQQLHGCVDSMHHQCSGFLRYVSPIVRN